MSTDEENNNEDEVETEEDVPEPEKTDEISVEEFLGLAETGEARGHKVDYDAVVKELLGRAVPIATIRATMLKHSTGKEAVYHSEVSRFLQTLPKKGYNVAVRFGDKKYVLITKKEKK